MQINKNHMKAEEFRDVKSQCKLRELRPASCVPQGYHSD